MSITNSLTMAESCLVHSPSSSLFYTKTKPQLFSLLSSKPLLKLHLSSLTSLSLTASSKTNRSPLFVAPTSDWAQQDGELEGAEEEAVTENEASLSAWEPNGEATTEIENGEGGFVEPSEDAKLFVGGLPYEFDSEKLAKLFEQAGTVEIAEVIYNRETDRSRGFGFVTMSTVEEAEAAADKFNGHDIDGRVLAVNKASPRGSRPERAPRTFEPAIRVYVGNLPWDFDDARLVQVFSEHGKVVSARVVYDRESGRSRGFGFVTMSDETEMNDAIAALDGQSLDGRTIRVSVAEDRPRRGSF